MKLELNTGTKTIKVEGTIKLGEFIENLEKLLPKESPFGYWKEYSIDCNTQLVWNSYPVYINPPYQWYNAPYTYRDYGTITSAGNYTANTNSVGYSFKGLDVNQLGNKDPKSEYFGTEKPHSIYQFELTN